MTNSPSRESWEAEFDNEFVDAERPDLLCSYVETKQVKDLIKSLLLSKDSELAALIERKRTRLSKKYPHKYAFSPEFYKGYNHALDDVSNGLKLINKGI